MVINDSSYVFNFSGSPTYTWMHSYPPSGTTATIGFDQAWMAYAEYHWWGIPGTGQTPSPFQRISGSPAQFPLKTTPVGGGTRNDYQFPAFIDIQAQKQEILAKYSTAPKEPTTAHGSLTAWFSDGFSIPQPESFVTVMVRARCGAGEKLRMKLEKSGVFHESWMVCDTGLNQDGQVRSSFFQTMKFANGQPMQGGAGQWFGIHFDAAQKPEVFQVVVMRGSVTPSIQKVSFSEFDNIADSSFRESVGAASLLGNTRYVVDYVGESALCGTVSGNPGSVWVRVATSGGLVSCGYHTTRCHHGIAAVSAWDDADHDHTCSGRPRHSSSVRWVFNTGSGPSTAVDVWGRFDGLMREVVVYRKTYEFLNIYFAKTTAPYHTTYFNPNHTADSGAYNPLRWINIRARGNTGDPAINNYFVMASHSVAGAIPDQGRRNYGPTGLPIIVPGPSNSATPFIFTVVGYKADLNLHVVLN